MSELDDLKAQARSDILDNAELIFRHTLTFTSGVTVRVGIRDPNRDRTRRGDSLEYSPVRFLKLHPDDTAPALAAKTAYQGGELFWGLPSDEAEFSGIQTFGCVLVDDRGFPSIATPKTGAPFRLRIEALDAKPAAPGGALALAVKLDASHEASLPPGVSILPGSSLTVTAGAFTGHRFEVVPPIQADPLGNRVGLSWKGTT